MDLRVDYMTLLIDKCVSTLVYRFPCCIALFYRFPTWLTTTLRARFEVREAKYSPIDLRVEDRNILINK